MKGMRTNIMFLREMLGYRFKKDVVIDKHKTYVNTLSVSKERVQFGWMKPVIILSTSLQE